MSQPSIVTHLQKIVYKMPESTQRFFQGRIDSFTYFNIERRDDIMLFAHAMYIFSNLEHLKKVMEEHLDESPNALNNPHVKRLR